MTNSSSFNMNGTAASGSSSSQPVKPPYGHESYPFVPLAYTQTKMLSEDVIRGLRSCLARAGGGADVYGRKDEQFKAASTLFNGAVRTNALAVVQPRSAVHVSEVIKYCRSNSLEMSVKAGGTGVHGWSVAGHVIIDLCRIDHMSISPPEDAPTLYDSFEALSLENRSPDAPSLSESASTKRNISDAMDGDATQDAAEGRGKRRTDAMDVQEDGSGSSGSSTPGMGDSDAAQSGRRSGTDSSREDSNGFQFASGSRGVSTPSTSIDTNGKYSANVERSHSGSSSSNSGESSASRVRMTYVNPSPTTAPVLPFISPPFGSSLSLGAIQSFPLASFNTNPNPPPFALVTFGAGVNSKQLDSFTASSPYGAFHVPTSAFPVGSGQFLAGGFGFMGRKYGLAMDNLVEAEMVLSDGRIVWVGEGGKCSGDWQDHENPEEVWWGLRGAGAALGVVTRFRAKAYYLPSVFAGNFIYVFNRQTTPELLRHIRDCVKGSSRDLYTNVIMTAGPPSAPGIVVIQLCYSGKRSEGETYVQAISSWEGGRPLFQDFSERTFERQQLAVEEVLKGGKGRKWYIKSDMLKSLTDEVIDASCDRFDAVPDGCTWLFEYTGGGAQIDIKNSCFPTSHREGQFTVAALHQWGHYETPLEDKRCVTTAEKWISEVIHPNSPGGPLPCFLQSSSEAEVAGVFGEYYPRLQRLKRTIDPDNFFRHAMWPPKTSPYEDGNAMDGEGATEAEFENGPAPNDASLSSGSRGADEGKRRVETFSKIVGAITDNPQSVRALQSAGVDVMQGKEKFKRDEGMVVDPIGVGDQAQ